MRGEKAKSGGAEEATWRRRAKAGSVLAEREKRQQIQIRRRTQKRPKIPNNKNENLGKSDLSEIRGRGEESATREKTTPLTKGARGKFDITEAIKRMGPLHTTIKLKNT